MSDLLSWGLPYNAPCEKLHFYLNPWPEGTFHMHFHKSHIQENNYSQSCVPIWVRTCMEITLFGLMWCGAWFVYFGVLGWNTWYVLNLLQPIWRNQNTLWLVHPFAGNSNERYLESANSRFLLHLALFSRPKCPYNVEIAEVGRMHPIEWCICWPYCEPPSHDSLWMKYSILLMMHDTSTINQSYIHAVLESKIVHLN